MGRGLPRIMVTKVAGTIAIDYAITRMAKDNPKAALVGRIIAGAIPAAVAIRNVHVLRSK